LESGLLRGNDLHALKFGEDDYACLVSTAEQLVCEAIKPPSSYSADDVTSFAQSLGRARGIQPTQDFGDSLYVERYSVLLPLWALSEPVSDAELLGVWVTGGVRVSIHSARRIKALAPWADSSRIGEWAEIAGLADSETEAKPDPAGSQQPMVHQGSASADPQREKPLPPSFSLAGRPELEIFFREHVIDIVENAERYAALGIHFPSAVVLHGPPGCGKTFAIERLVEYLDWPAFRIEAASVGSPYIHETSRKIAEVFEQAAEHAPSAIIIDEMEAFLADRQTSASSGSHRVEEVGEFLRRIPEAIEKRVFIAGMTNRIEMIDPAILRRGRFDHVIEVGMPSRIEIKALLESLLEPLPTAAELELDQVIDDLAGKAPSDIAFVVKEAGRLAAKAGCLELQQTHLETATRTLPQTAKTGPRQPIGFVWARNAK
jgi:hypothetical protein